MTQSFPLHKPFNPVPFIVTPIVLLTFGAAAYSLRSVLIPLAMSRIIWGTASLVLILTFTSGYMWNKIKNTPYVAVGEGGKISWFAGGFQNQLGMESQIVGVTCECIYLSVKMKRQTANISLRWCSRVRHRRPDGLCTRADVAYEAENRRLPLACRLHRRFLGPVQALQDQERRLPVQPLVLGRLSRKRKAQILDLIASACNRT